MTRLVGAFVLLLALSCASPVAGQAASAQGGMYYGPFRGPLYGAGTIGAIDPFMGGFRSVAVVPTVSFGGAPRVLPTGPVGGIIGPYGRPAPIGGGVGVSRTTVVNRGAGVSGVIRPGGRGPVNRPNRRGRLLQTATIV